MRAGTVMAAIAMLIGGSLGPGAVASAQSPQECAPSQPGGPMQVTADCVDPQYGKPVIDSEEDVTSPVPHRKVSGHFDGTGSRFNFYLPPKARWNGRFFQVVYPLQGENATDDDIAFAADSGAYRVQTNGSSGYRIDAAAAKFSKQVAARYYGTSRRIFGYVYGGSGGSFQTISAIENSTGVWDGAVPFIPGTPQAIPHNFFVRAFARLVLSAKAPRISDAVKPGGSGEPSAGLSDVERAVFTEVTKMGVPLRAWENYRYVLGMDDPQGLLGFASTVRALDPAYRDDFWGKAGYLGAERSPLGDLFRGARIDHPATVTKVNRDAQGRPASLVVDGVPANPANLLLDFTVHRADGTPVAGTLAGTLDPATKVFTIGADNSAELLGALTEGAKLHMDNRWSLALLAYHRYQVPARPGFHAWDQFRDAAGQPIHPQRPVEVAPLVSRGVTGGGTFSGKITGKVIVVVNLLDTDAYPWDADWYASQVKQALGNRYDGMFRVWFNDHADHVGANLPGLIDYRGILQQAVRDVSAWAERGVAPARSTRYTMADSQIRVPASAWLRRGIQPVVDLTAGGGTRIDVPAGRPVTFKAVAQVPPGAGKAVSAEWDFTGDGVFQSRPSGPPRERVELSATHTYTTPGTYIVSLRVTANRDGKPAAPFANVQNLGRVRVVVH